MSFLSALEEDFPPLDDVFSADARPKSKPRRRHAKNDARFQRNMERVAAGCRQRGWVFTGLIVLWIVLAMGVAISTKNPFANILALGGAGGGTVWCATYLRRLGLETMAAEMLVALTAHKSDSSGEVADLCRKILQGQGALPDGSANDGAVTGGESGDAKQLPGAGTEGGA